MSKPIRVLHCPTNVGSHPVALCAAERLLGLESESMAYSCSALTSPPDICLGVEGKNPLGELKRQFFFWKSLSRYDVYHFNFGLSFFQYPGILSLFNNWDLPLLKALGKTIIVTYQGCDARDREACARELETTPCAEEQCGLPYCNEHRTRRKRRSIARFNQFADHIFSVTPDVLPFLPDRTDYLPFASVDPALVTPHPPGNKERLCVVHAPSDTCIKGSSYVNSAIETIMTERDDVDYIRVENMPRKDALREYARADVVVDQLLVGSYGTLAVEAMALGKPVICYIRESDMQNLPTMMWEELPIVSATPETIQSVLSDLLNDRSRLKTLGEHGRKYVERWHNPTRVAEQTKKVYHRYVFGSGKGE